MAKRKYYAVRNGRYGPDIYETWNDCSRAVHRWPGAEYKGFATLGDAQLWLKPSISSARSMEQSEYSESSEEGSLDDLDRQFVPLAEFAPVPSSQEPTQPFTEDFIPLPSSPDLRAQRPFIPASRPPVTLSDEQIKIFNLVLQRKNVFFTGSAGTGKSVLLRQIIEHLRGYNTQSVAVTASTGIAAVNIGGVTLHSWAGIGLGVGTFEYLTNKVKNNQAALKRWRTTKTLIIDEVSMIDGLLFDYLEHIGRSICEKGKPFGGIQLVLSGDFCQLPPVPGRDRRHPSFAFEAKSWAECFGGDNGSIHRLTKVYRQSDQKFVDMLNALRKGQLDPNTTAQFSMLSRPLVYDDGLEACELFPLRDQVYLANHSRLNDLPGSSHVFVANDIGGYDAHHRPVTVKEATTLLNKFSLAPDELTLKVGAQVMLIKNLSQGRLVNGSMGQVVDFKSLKEAEGTSFLVFDLNSTDRHRTVIDQLIAEYGSTTKWPLVRFLNGDLVLLPPIRFEVLNMYAGVEASRHQVPLILAWALSIHKSQGQTLERVKVDLSKIFENGQAYVALSRATTLEGLEVQNFHPSKIMAHPRVLTFYEDLENKTTEHQAELQFDEFDNLPDDEAIQAYYSAVLDG